MYNYMTTQTKLFYKLEIIEQGNMYTKIAIDYVLRHLMAVEADKSSVLATQLDDLDQWLEKVVYLVVEDGVTSQFVPPILRINIYSRVGFIISSI